ncbi:MAG TPA: DEAD/DEAH box helicase [Candidatus Thermoplasmatota archaeon]|nr:DEAD/DEAH box helicase [Candidatus Thermoplasmatota archaeon]
MTAANCVSPVDEALAARLEPEVGRWALDRFGAFTPPQREAVPKILDGRNVLISSPTGSGKTLSAFLAALDGLVGLAKRGRLEDRVHLVYVSPLKALNNDIERNLVEPLTGIRRELDRAGVEAAAIRVGVRTGDTSPRERARQTAKPPHVLITTPESLAILLSAPRYGEHLAGARWVIVDEVHALAESKRGVHLALSLERLEARVVAAGRPPPVRIGLSATLSPLDAVARFLFGPGRDGDVVDVQYLKDIDLSVVTPVPDLVRATGPEVMDGLYRLLDGLIEKHRTTLVFTNTRAGTERLVLHLKQRYGRKYADLAGPGGPPGGGADEARVEGPDAAEGGDPVTAPSSFIAAHHGSLSRERRHEVESRLKAGDLKCVVCSTSLELGIDIGYVDLVVLLGSPKGIARALQRVGRSGHKLGETSRGIIVPLDRDDLVESVVLAREARARRLDRVTLPANALDVLAQHLVGLSLEGVQEADAVYALVRRAGPYADLPREDFDATLRYLAGSGPGLEERRIYGKVWYDATTGRFGRKGRMARPIYSLNVGTIPETTHAVVYDGERYVGQIEEAFLESLNPGDVFVLGGTTWAFLRAQGMKAQVASASGRRPTVPAWSSEKLPLAYDLARAVARFREEVGSLLATRGRDVAEAFVREAYHVDAVTASSILAYFSEQARFAAVPAADEVLVEEFVDDDLRRNYVVHTLLGRRANEALARVFAKRISDLKGVNARVQVADSGFIIAVPRACVLTATDVRGLFFSEVRREAPRALEGTELLKRRFRHVATRAFLILRNYAGREKSVGRQQVNSFVLYHVLKRLDPDFPVLKELRRELEDDALDVARAEALTHAVLTRQAKVTLLRNRKAPSPFAHGLVALGATDTVVMEDRKAFMLDLHERVLELLEHEAARPA